MKKRALSSVIFMSVVLTALLVGPAFSDNHEELPEHPHLHVIGLEFGDGGEPVGWRKCHDLANGQALRLNAHHEHLHFGRAGLAQFEAGNAVVPAAPFPGVPWTNCDELAEIVFGE